LSASQSQRKFRIGVLGPHRADAKILADAAEIGKKIAEAGAILLCGGLGGVMEAAARGAKSAGGATLGILPGISANEANDFIDFPIVTGMSEARNVILVRSCDAVIAVGGAYGTLSEIAFALRLGVPVVGLRTWNLRDADGKIPPILVAETPEDAVKLALEAAKK
jgi:uncharacterized protein (TIGR00725 family)